METNKIMGINFELKKIQKTLGHDFILLLNNHIKFRFFKPTYNLIKLKSFGSEMKVYEANFNSFWLIKNIDYSYP